MLPANMFGRITLNTLGCQVCSPCRRTSGIAVCQAVSPCFLYDTSTFALRLASPSMCHSKPRFWSVGCSITNSPGVTGASPGAAASGRPRLAIAASSRNISEMYRRMMKEDVRMLGGLYGGTPHRRPHVDHLGAIRTRGYGMRDGVKAVPCGS